MNAANSTQPRPSFPTRLARRLRRELRRPFKPLLHWLRDRQAPSLHHWMMHEAAVPIQPTRKSALVIAPHHDDETFGCGGLIALKRDAGIAVSVLVITDGRQSHGHVAGVDLDAMVETRRRELLQACSILGVAEQDVHLMSLPDQGVYRLGPEEFQLAANAIAAMITALHPQELYVNHRNDRHPDHEAVFRLVKEAIQIANVPVDLLEYPIWLIWNGPYRWNTTPDDLKGALRLDVRSVQDRKNRAIAAYASQHAILPKGFLEQFTQGYELFFRHTSL